MIRKFKHRHHIYQVEGYVTSHIIEIENGFLVEYLPIPDEYWKGRKNK